MSENMQSEPIKTTHRIRGFVIYVACCSSPSCLASSPCGSSLVKAPAVFLRQSANQAWPRCRIPLAAQRSTRGGEIMRQARQAASDFFTFLRAEMSKDVDSALSQAQEDGAQLLLAQRDQIITLLARGM